MKQAQELEEHYFEQKLDESDEIYNQELQREKQNQAAVQFSKVKLRDLFPVNYLSQRDKFFEANCQYCPHFLYKTVVYPQPVNLSTEHESLAIKILKNSPPYDSTPYLSKEQVRAKIAQYLQNLGLKDYVEVNMEFECLSRTRVAYFKNKAILKIRTPLTYTTVNLEGVLNHQVGTHILRMLNHRENCVRKPSEKGKIIEEGLASLNQLLPQQKPFLFKPALRYLAAIYASKYNFIELYKRLNKFIADKDECWRECVRVKRGIANTQEKGGFYKDQNYLVGAIQILRNRKNIDFEKIYYGRLAPEQTKNLTQGVLPPFVDTPQKMIAYKKKLEIIALCNFMDVDEVEKQTPFQQ